MSAPALGGKDYDRWYTIEMEGKRAGWMHTIQNTTGDRIETLSDSRIDVKRGSSTVSIVMSSAFKETRGGKPLWMESVMKFGAGEVRQDFTFTDKSLEELAADAIKVGEIDEELAGLRKKIESAQNELARWDLQAAEPGDIVYPDEMRAAAEKDPTLSSLRKQVSDAEGEVKRLRDAGDPDGKHELEQKQHKLDALRQELQAKTDKFLRGLFDVKVDAAQKKLDQLKAQESKLDDRRRAAEARKKVVWVTESGGQRTEQDAPVPLGIWLTPAAADDYVTKRIAAGATEISICTIDPSFGLATFIATRSEPTPETITAKGREIKATRWVLTNSITPDIDSIEYTDASGDTILSTMNIGGIPVTMRATTREAAMRELDPPEMMVSTLVSAGGPIANARTSRRASYVLSMSDAELPDLPTEGAQRVTRIDERSARVQVDADHPAPAGEVDRDVMLGSSSMIDPTDEKVKELTKDAVRTASDRPADQAEAIRRYVHRYVREKSLGVGFAGSGEVARTREGDCTEHAVLLAAMLRADGIPARVASGLIYVPSFAGATDVFGYHMWAQALLEVDGTERWVDLDAVLDDEPFDATHIALVVTPLEEGQGPTAMAAMAPLLGRLQIKVESVE